MAACAAPLKVFGELAVPELASLPDTEANRVQSVARPEPPPVEPPDGALATAMLSACVAVWGEVAESFAWTVNANVPEALGVPLIVPEAESESPGGSCPEDTVQVYGGVPAEAASVA
jgi:hypothetical protein